MQNFLMILILVISALTVEANDCGSVDPKWLACAKDDDCVLTTVGTCDPETAINRTTQKTYEAYHACIAPYIGACAPNTLQKGIKKVPQAICKNKQCKVSR